MTRLRRESLFLRVSTIAVAAVLASMPVTIGRDLSGPAWKSALADKGGKGGGGGNQGGGNHSGGHQEPGGRGHAYGHDKNAGEHGRKDGAEYDDFGTWVEDVRAGKAVGHDRRDEHLERAKRRYQEAVNKSRGQGKADIDRNREVAHRFSSKETRELIDRGWRARTINAGYRNHGQRVHTMVELAKRLGYGARVGAMQANFGTPFENGIADLQAELAEAREAAAANPDDAAAQQRVAQLNAELGEAITAAKPGKGPDDSWATADLDVNDDGVVDPNDLAALDEAAPQEAVDAAKAPAS